MQLHNAMDGGDDGAEDEENAEWPVRVAEGNDDGDDDDAGEDAADDGHGEVLSGPAGGMRSAH